MDLLREARKNRGLTQYGMAGAIGTTEGYYRRLESGAALPSLELLMKMLKALRLADPLELGYRLEVTHHVVVNDG